MISLAVAAFAGWVFAHATTRTTVLNFAINSYPKVMAWMKSQGPVA